jgi:hypothetical protein
VLTGCEAAALRYVHDVVTGEFVTIGIVVLCPDRKFVAGRFTRDFKRVAAAFPESDRVHLRRVCIAIMNECDALRSRLSGELPFAPAPGLAHVLPQLLPREDAALQFSPVISGVTRDPERTVGELFDRYVGAAEDKPERQARTEEDVWRGFAHRLPDPGLTKRLEARTVGPERFRWDFDYTWKNGAVHALQPLSLDLVDAHNIVAKAAKWSGYMRAVKPRDYDVSVHILVGTPASTRARDIRQAARNGIDILRDIVGDHADVVPEREADGLLRRLVRDLAAPN